MKDIRDRFRSDIIVCGGGPAGFAAALTAARSGARVQLIERSGALGGTWTLGILSTVSDMRRKTQLIQELGSRLEAIIGAPLRYDQSGIIPAVEYGFSISPEWVKLSMESMCREAGVNIRLYSTVTEVRREGNLIRSVVTESKSGREEWVAPIFVDATGDGDLAAAAGCAFEQGNPENGRSQPLTMHVLVTGLNEDDVRPYIRWGRSPADKGKRLDFAEVLNAAGAIISYGQPTIHQLGEGLFILGINHEYEPDSLNADALTEATLRGRAECLNAVAALRKYGGIWANIEAAVTSSFIGVREGRRIRGRYVVSRDDLLKGRRHADSICRVTFPVDIHSTDPEQDKGYGDAGVQMHPYDIPLRALIAADVDNLILAGRCISGDFYAHASYRVVGNAIAMGEAAGILAHKSVIRTCPPASVPFSEVTASMVPLN